MSPVSLHEFFAASASVSGALIGLLFVAISVSPERLTADDASQVHRVRASAALSAFTNSLVISLFALITGLGLAWVAFVTGVLGVLFVASSLLSIRRLRLRQSEGPRDALFLLGMMIALGFQLYYAVRLIIHAHDVGAARGVAVVVVVSSLFGISRAWELIGGPRIGMGGEVKAMLVGRRGSGDGGST